MNVVGVLLLLILVVIAGVLLWLWYGATIPRAIPSHPQNLVRGLKIEAASFTNSRLVIYVRNLGGISIVIDKVYIRLGESTVAVHSVGIFTLTVWGGDIWDFSGVFPKLRRSGLILYDDFDTLNRDLWTEASYRAAYKRLTVENSYLKIEVSSRERFRWATYGLFTTKTINIPENYVVEVELWKRGSAKRYYAVCLYLMSTNKSTNPYYNTPWFAIKLYPRRRATHAQLVYRDKDGNIDWENLYNWTYGYPHAHIVAMVKNSYVETVLLWVGNRDGDPERIPDLNFQAISGDLYIALTVDTTETWVCRGWIGYVKIYRDTAFTLEGLQPGKAYVLRGSSGSCKITPQSTEIVIDPLNPPPGCEWLRDEFYRHGYPIELEIESDVFRVVKPRSVKPIGLEIRLPPGVYSIEVVSREGVSAITSITIAR